MCDILKFYTKARGVRSPSDRTGTTSTLPSLSCTMKSYGMLRPTRWNLPKVILCLFYGWFQESSTVSSAFISGRHKLKSLRSPTARQPLSAVTTGKEELLELVQATPSGRATPQRLTALILDKVRTLERSCPTPDDQVLSNLAGAWELLWTAQDPDRPETRRFASSWINPLENQSYSNNPEGRANPFLPVELQSRLERLGLVSSVASRRSTQTIDAKTGLIRNVVAIQLGPNASSSRRASLTVLVKFTPVQADPRRVNVKFEACRVSVPGTPIDWNFPLGLIGPSGWLRTVYIDDDLRVTRGHKGSVFVLSRPRRATV
jgi:PAP_fibrillin